MMRTVEILLVIVILAGAFVVASLFAVLPSPREVSPINLRRLALTTLQTLDMDYDLSKTVFMLANDSSWRNLQVALSACLPPNMVYNMTVYEVLNGTAGELYLPLKSISNAENSGTSSDSSSYLVASSNVTFSVLAQKIGESGTGGTLYILNCSDSNGWWITGYTSQSLAGDLYNLLSPYFQKTVLIQNTTQFAGILNNIPIGNETVQNAVVINTFGECVPIPTDYCQGQSRGSEGYQAGVSYPYTKFCYTLGQKTRQFNWTWASIVGYPLYYVSNKGFFTNGQNGWGIYGMQMVSQGGINAFLEGLDNQAYQYNDGGITSSPGVVYLSSEASYYCNYYGIYPSSYQTSTRALSTSILPTYNLTVALQVLQQSGNYNPGALYNHISAGATNVTGSLLALGLTRTPDIRLTAVGLLSYFKPRLYRSEYTASGTSRLVVLQLGQLGGA
jgi:hypothetical protein